MSGERDDERSARWEAKKAHYQSEEVVAQYDAARFRGRHERKSTERKWKRIQAHLGERLQAGAEVLDVPSGTGRFTRAVLDAGYALTSADLSFPMLQAARETAGDSPQFRGAVRCDVERLPFGDGVFDLVLSIRFLFHVPVDLRVALLKEMGRVSRGYVVVDVRHKYCYSTHTKRLKAWILGRRMPSKRASLAEIERDFKAAGLRVVKRTWLAPGLSEKMLVICEAGAERKGNDTGVRAGE
ncbi:MAG: methyltransferase domain-containing protein [Planctomycetes bacterium]|nr:methyltransferase domain-containing protein [Planctomycetota bacterium]